jgi:hypothetical protein
MVSVIKIGPVFNLPHYIYYTCLINVFALKCYDKLVLNPIWLVLICDEKFY